MAVTDCNPYVSGSPVFGGRRAVPVTPTGAVTISAEQLNAEVNAGGLDRAERILAVASNNGYRLRTPRADSDTERSGYSA